MYLLGFDCNLPLNLAITSLLLQNKTLKATYVTYAVLLTNSERVALPFNTQSLSCWALSPWIHIAGQL